MVLPKLWFLLVHLLEFVDEILNFWGVVLAPTALFSHIWLRRENSWVLTYLLAVESYFLLYGYVSGASCYDANIMLAMLSLRLMLYSWSSPVALASHKDSLYFLPLLRLSNHWHVDHDWGTALKSWDHHQQKGKKYNSLASVCDNFGVFFCVFFTP